jgi:hypothetical protein
MRLTFAGVLDDSSVLLITETVAGNILQPFFVCFFFNYVLSLKSSMVQLSTLDSVVDP